MTTFVTYDIVKLEPNNGAKKNQDACCPRNNENANVFETKCLYFRGNVRYTYPANHGKRSFQLKRYKIRINPNIRGIYNKKPRSFTIGWHKIKAVPNIDIRNIKASKKTLAKTESIISFLKRGWWIVCCSWSSTSAIPIGLTGEFCCEKTNCKNKQTIWIV